MTNYSNYGKIESNSVILRITALWGFSEAALGGILHAFKIPFTGLFIGGAAVIFISLLSAFSDKKNIIIRSTLVVILIKAIISPYTPLTAYLAVFIQGLLGFIFFSLLKPPIIASVTLGLVTSLLSAVQKVIILTIVYGNTLWESVDVFSDYVLKQFVENPELNFSLSMSLIIMYISLHTAGGIMFGILGGKLPIWITEFDKNKLKELNHSIMEFDIPVRKRKHKKWWGRLSGLLIILVSLFLIILSYRYEKIDSSFANQIMFMLGRSVIILIVWYYVLSPYILKIFKKYLLKKRVRYSEEIENSIKMFPLIRSAIKASWAFSDSKTGIERYKYFITVLILYVLFEN
ncbi:MAG: hypothetical protein KKB34_13695 [Bacteroidetes bacterium]|nr:hypothetical protein [Bacteroidota bacterium]